MNLFLFGLLCLGIIVVLLVHSARSGASLIPLWIFLGLEVAVVWPPLMNPSPDVGSFPAMLAMLGAVVAAIGYVGSVGATTRVSDFRTHIPDKQHRRLIVAGITFLAATLVALATYMFQGLPPIGASFSSMIDPASDASSVDQIRHARRDLTKGRYLDGGRPGLGVLRIVVVLGWQFLCVAAALYWSWSRSRASLVGAGVIALLALGYLAALGSRAPILAAGVMVVIGLLLRFRPKVSRLVVAFLLIVGLGILISPLSKGVGDQDGVVGRVDMLTARVMTGNGQNNVRIVDLVDNGVLNQEPGSLFLERAREMVPGLAAEKPFALRLTHLAYDERGRTTSFSTPSQFGLLYADWGVWGILPGYLGSGIVLGLLWRALLLVREPMAPILLAPMCWAMAYVSISGVHALIVTGGVGVVFYRFLAGSKRALRS